MEKEIVVECGIKFASQVTLRQGACSALSEQTQCKHKVLKSERGRQKSRLLALKVEEGATKQEMRQPLEAGKGKEMDGL